VANFADVQGFAAGIHAMPCTNRCRHCWTEGSSADRGVPEEQVNFVLRKLAELRADIPNLWFFLYAEPTAHPQFIGIVEQAAQLGLIRDGFFLPTNGSGLAKAPDETWERLKNAGCRCLQLTVYGLEQTHDAFAGRRGAFQNIVAITRRARGHEIAWYAGIILHSGNVGELIATISSIKTLDPNGSSQVGWFPFLWQGRGREAHRVRAAEYARLPAEMRERATYMVEEREAVSRILDSPVLSAQPAGGSLCSVLTFHVDRDLKVFCGGSCDSGGIAAAAPQVKEEFYLGTLNEEGFAPLVESYLKNPPRSIKLLNTITWGELAIKYGDKNNDELYFLNDLPENKWAAAYLCEALGNRAAT
jgi:hypothetical protein